MRAVWFSAAVVWACAVGAQEPQVPDGFTIQKVVGYPLLHRPIFAGFDDQGVLYVGESNGENLRRDDMLAKKPHWITRLEDTDGDGVFDKSTRFVENITLPQGCLWYRGSLYAACPPSIWKFTDTDGDGKADQREEILTGFGFSGNACDTHGPFLSPTGRLYIVQGRHGHEFKDKDGNVYSKGKAARIYSCRADGSDVRVHAGGGFDNPVEVDFTEEGECIGTVNILYRDRGDCLMHWVEGGVYPREDQADCVAEFQWTGGLLGPVHNLGHVAVSGITRYRGVHFGKEFKDRWFFTEFNTHKVRYADLKRTGSTFSADVHEFLTCEDGDFHPTDVLEDADGSLLVLNTGGWFLNGCPTSRVAKPEIYGGIYRIRKVGGTKLDDPRGTMIPVADLPADQLVSLLDDQRPAVVARAVDEFSRRGDEQTIAGLRQATLPRDGSRERYLSTPPVTTARRRNVVWAASRFMNQVADASARLPVSPQARTMKSLLVEGLQDSDSSIRQAATVASGWIGSRTVWAAGQVNQQEFPASTTPQLVRQMLESAAVALETVRRTPEAQWDREERLISRKLAVDMIRKLVLSGTVEDSFAEHAAVVALTRANDAESTRPALSMTHAPRWQRIALIALDQMDGSPLTREMVLPLLSSEDARLQQTALEVIARHPGWAAETLALLKTWVSEPKLSTDRAQALRGFLLAQLEDPAVQGFVVDVLSDRETAGDVRALFWEVLQRSTIAEWPDAWNPLVVAALQSDDDGVTLPALRIVTQRSLASYVFGDELKRLAADEQRSLIVRSEAVVGLGARGATVDQPVFDTLLAVLKNPESSATDTSLAARALGSAKLTHDQLLALTVPLQTVGPLELGSLVKAFAQSKDPAVGFVFLMSLGKNEATVSLSGDEMAAVLRRYPQETQDFAAPLLKALGADPLAQAARLHELTPLLEGGDEKLGRNIFFGKKANCSACHAVAGEGGRIGPHLTTIGASRAPKDLLEAIVFPSASFVNGYRPYVVVTDDGKVVQGVISAETTDAITLRTQDLQEIRIRRDAIDELREGSTSIMPKGLDTQLSPDELRHLLAYLRSRK